MVARSTIKLDESQTLNLRKLSYVGGLMSKGQVGVLFWEHRVWILRIVSLYKVRPEACWAFFQTERTQNISTLSCFLT